MFGEGPRMARMVMGRIQIVKARARQPKVASIGRGRRASSKNSFIADQRGAAALEMLIVYLFLGTSLLLPLADISVAGLQYASAWQALRALGQQIQYNPPPDVTAWASWKSALPTSVGGYPINNLQVLCSDAVTACSAANTASPKYYSYTTTVTLAPMVLRSVLCTSGNANPCSFTLPYSERFQ
jgi:hypothetical protein